MTIKELITKLLEYNMNADVHVIAHCQQEDFTITYSYFGQYTDYKLSETDKKRCSDVSFYVDRLCTNDNITKE